MSTEQRVTSPTSLVSADCLHPELPLTDKIEQKHLAQLATALAENKLDEDAYDQLLTRLKAGSLSPAALYRFANLCYRQWQNRWPTANNLQTQQAEVERQIKGLQTMAKGRMLFRRASQPSRYYWGQPNATTESTAEKGRFYRCYPTFEAGQARQGEGITTIYQAEEVIDASHVAACDAYTKTQRDQQLIDQLFQQGTVLHEKLQHCDDRAKVIVNLQLAWLYYRSGRVMHSISVHEAEQAVFYIRQALGTIARHALTQQQPPLPMALATVAEQLQQAIDQALIEQAQQAVFSAQTTNLNLLERWLRCYQEPQPKLDTIYQLSQQTAELLTQAVSVPPVAKQPLIDAWLAGFNRGLVGEDDQEVRVAMQDAVTRACNPAQKYPHSLATMHQWLLTMAQQLQQHSKIDRAKALLRAYQNLLTLKLPNLQQNLAASTTNQGEPPSPYTDILAACQQALAELNEWSAASDVVAESKTTITPSAPSSAFTQRSEQILDWYQTLTQSLAANTKASDIYLANTQFTRNLLADICREIEHQIGAAPCAYTLLGAGSFSRGEISPASDLDCALLVAEDSAKTHPWFRCFLQLLQWKLASLPTGILALESETLAWITKGYWFDTPAGFIEQHLSSQQPNDCGYQQPENFGAQWFRWIYSGGNQPQEKDALLHDYQQRLQAFFHTSIGTSSPLPAYQQLAPWSLTKHVGHPIAPQRRELFLSFKSAPANTITRETKETKDSEYTIGISATPAATTTTFTTLNVKNLSYRLINAILCYGRFYDVPSGITTTREVLAYLKDRQCLPTSFVTRLEAALDQLYTWRLRQHWAWLHHTSELGENEVVLWPEDAAQQAAIAALPTEWRGFYLDKTETEQCWTIMHYAAEVIGRSAEGFVTYASHMPTAASTKFMTAMDPAASLSSSTTTTVPEVKETKEAKREVNEEEAQAILAMQSRAVAEAKAATQPSTIPTFNPLAAAVAWTLQQLAKPKGSKVSPETDDKLRSEHVTWLARVMGNRIEELLVDEPHSNDPARVKQDPLFRKHWQMYWAIPTAWRGLYIKQLRSSSAVKLDDIIEPLVNAPNHVGWRLSTQISEQQWQNALRPLFAAEPRDSLPIEAKTKIAQGAAVWVSWVEQEAIRWAPLRQEYVERLIDSEAKTWKSKQNSSGNHRLYQLQTQQERFWLKLYPEQPGTEYLVAALDRRLGVKGTPPQQLLALHHAPLRVPDGTPHGLTIVQSAALLVPHVGNSNQNLHRISKQHPEQLDQLDFISFAKTLLRVLLANPEDDKGDDYFLLRSSDSRNDRYQLMRIDNERAFLPVTHITAGKRPQEELQVKSILYCLDQMLLPWSSDPRTAALLDDLHQLQPSALVLDLLQDIERQQRCWQQLFPNIVVERHACLQDPWMSLPVFMLPQGLESALLTRITSLQTALRLLEPSAITGLELLKLVQPKLAQYYNDKLFQGKLARNPQQPQATVWARFDQVAGRYYRQSAAQAASVGAADNQVSLYSGPTVYSRQLSVALPELPKTNEERDALIAFAHSIWSQQTHSIKQALQGAQSWQHLQAERVRKELLALLPEARTQFGWLSAREQQQILDQLLSTPAAPLTPQQQQFLLSALVGAQCHNLDLRPFRAVLTNKLLLPILQEADKQIIQLNLSDCKQLTANILKDIECYCPHLRQLSVRQVNWTNLSLTNLPQLEQLDLSDSGVKTLTGEAPRLRSLQLANCQQLRSLGENQLIQDNPFFAPALTEINLSACERLTELWLPRELFFSKVVPQLQQLHTASGISLKAVTLRVGTKWIRVPNFLIDPICRGLTKLNYKEHTKLLHEQWKLLTKYLPYDQFFTCLDLTHSQALTTLNPSENQLGEAGVRVLAEVLKTNTTLTTLNLCGNRLSEAGAKALAEALKTNTTLTTLNLSGNQLGEAGVRVLAEALKTNTTLTTLNLRGNWLGEAGVRAMAEVLKTNTALTTLDLSGNQLGFPGLGDAQALAEALKTNATLTTLNLSRNQLGATDTQVLTEALKTNTTITTLEISGNRLGKDGVRAMAEVLKTNTAFTTLDLSWNQLGATDTQVLTEALKTNTTLTTLDISGSQLDEAGVQVLAEVIKTNVALTALNLSNIQLGATDTQVLTEALKTNTTLTTVVLWNKRRLTRNRQRQKMAKATSQPKDSKSTHQPSPPLLDKKKEAKDVPRTPLPSTMANSSLETLPAVEALGHTTVHSTTSSVSSMLPRERKIEAEVDVINAAPSRPSQSVLAAPRTQFFPPCTPSDEKAQRLLSEIREALDHAYPPRMVEHSATRRAYLTQLAEYQSHPSILNQAERTLLQLLATLKGVLAQREVVEPFGPTVLADDDIHDFHAITGPTDF